MSETETRPVRLTDALLEAQAAAGLLKQGVALLESFLNDPSASDDTGGWFIAAGLKTQVQRLYEHLQEAEKIEVRTRRALMKPPTKEERLADTRRLAGELGLDLPADRIPAFQEAYEAEAAKRPREAVAVLAGRALARIEQEAET